MSTRGNLLDYVTAEPVRVAALLRLPLIGLIVFIVDVGDVAHWLPEVYNTAIISYLVAALIWLAVVFRGPTPSWAGWVTTLVDVLAVVAVCLTSGGATAWLLPVFFVLPISVAFQDRPWLTALLGAVTAFAYLGVWIVYSKRDDTVGLPNIVYMHFAFLMWFALATTGLSLVIARRDDRVRGLLKAQRQLVSESLRADERNSRELAETLHDGPLQELLAARMALDELSERVDDPAVTAIRDTLTGTATQLRSTLRTLHPAVLSELGLTPALAELLRQYRDRASFTVEAELDDVGKPPVQDLLYRAARELLGNVSKHARASSVCVTLKLRDEDIELIVTDDGAGFDPNTLDTRIADGHIGLASLKARVEAMGGTFDIISSRGHGTRARLVAPAAG
ncbi:sensor histidine kinase [Mycobacterium sp. ACS4331]|uniref:sensor histidine kinase n=1 Tax=Mycobacterium sp. ACS4331 TaxID=1834121 RepID=UPI0007FE45E9|nr:sensor histidine kinase [Mycobacterium sp. ACS4331]OBF19998.1 ATPase [Mycobacterium sp. ACS4331]